MMKNTEKKGKSLTQWGIHFKYFEGSIQSWKVKQDIRGGGGETYTDD